MTSKRQTITALLLIAAASWIAYGNSLENEFVFDDLDQVVNMYSIQSLKNIPDILGLTGAAPNYRPVRTLSYCIDYLFTGLDPTGYHVFNIIYHILAALLLYLITARLLKSHSMALAAAILFAVHPVHTDAVTYISGRRDVLSTLFYLAGFYWFLRFRERPLKRYLGLAAAAYLLGLFTKEMAVTLPVLFVAHDLCFIPGRKGDIVRNFWPQYVLFFLIAGLYTWHAVGQYPSDQINMEHTILQSAYAGSRYQDLLTAARIVCFYILLMFFPVTLNADYSFNAFPLSQSFLEPRTMLAFAVLAAVVCLMVRFRRRTPALFAALWFFITILPVSRIIPHHEMLAEHYLYLPSAGFCILLGWLASRTRRAPGARKAVSVILALAVVLFSARTIVRNRDWKDSLTLWGKTVQTAPDCARAQCNYGAYLYKAGRNKEALEHLDRALEIAPDYFLPHHNLALIYYNTEGWSEKVKRETALCLEKNPYYPLGYFNRGWFYHREGRLDDARREYERTLELRPAFIRALVNLAAVNYQQGRVEEALELCRRAEGIDPNNVEVQLNLAKLYRATGQAELAEAAAHRAREIQEERKAGADRTGTHDR